MANFIFLKCKDDILIAGERFHWCLGYRGEMASGGGCDGGATTRIHHQAQGAGMDNRRYRTGQQERSPQQLRLPREVRHPAWQGTRRSASRTAESGGPLHRDPPAWAYQVTLNLFLTAVVRFRVFGQISDPGLCTSNEGRF